VSGRRPPGRERPRCTPATPRRVSPTRRGPGLLVDLLITGPATRWPGRPTCCTGCSSCRYRPEVPLGPAGRATSRTKRLTRCRLKWVAQRRGRNGQPVVRSERRTPCLRCSLVTERGAPDGLVLRRSTDVSESSRPPQPT
jgi:hypothetical protein